MPARRAEAGGAGDALRFEGGARCDEAGRCAGAGGGEAVAVVAGAGGILQGFSPAHCAGM